jgi:hypothetical protein
MNDDKVLSDEEFVNKLMPLSTLTQDNYNTYRCRAYLLQALKNGELIRKENLPSVEEIENIISIFACKYGCQYRIDGSKTAQSIRALIESKVERIT